MTCIVGFIDKSKRRMVIGGDRLGSNGHTGESVTRAKIFKKRKVLIGYTTSFRFGQILEHHLVLPKDTRDDPYSYMILDVLPEVRTILETHKYSRPEADGDSGTAIMLYKGKIYVLQTDWAILEYDSIHAIGSGSTVATGAMIALTDINIKGTKKVQIALEAASDVVLSVGGPYDVMTLKY